MKYVIGFIVLLLFMTGCAHKVIVKYDTCKTVAEASFGSIAECEEL